MLNNKILHQFGGRLLLSVTAAAVMQLLAAAPALAYLAHTYTVDSSVVPGMIVSAKPDQGTAAEATTTANIPGLLGVALRSASGESAGSIGVVTSGVTSTLVSTLGGDIHRGDALTISPVTGVGMRAVGAAHIVGTAQADFNAHSEGSLAQSVKESGGKTQSYSFGQISVDVVINNSAGSSNAKALLPQGLQDFFDNLAGHSVSPIRVIASLIILLFGLVIVTVIVETTIRASLVALGRNPLARKDILKSLTRVALFVGFLTIMILGVVYIVIAF